MDSRGSSWNNFFSLSKILLNARFDTLDEQPEYSIAISVALNQSFSQDVWYLFLPFVFVIIFFLICCSCCMLVFISSCSPVLQPRPPSLVPPSSRPSHRPQPIVCIGMTRNLCVGIWLFFRSLTFQSGVSRGLIASDNTRSVDYVSELCAVLSTTNKILNC